ncbi:phytanoyl-CoA dioxygenase family protein [Paenibacillus sp. FSL W8-1187]|uniref:SnoK-like protein n=1 Tax=Paenibacillus pasadenensis TaxID=217090 RepID=A0A2N5N2A0_9BACL|nr:MULTISPECIES: phytanoyl-CoA dioxygenase family protein [Paenibacillus]PLT44464.1 SnoK-like protein [Paenibacillus pasadenensis]QGG54939.1 phytanoyl-CoA dioxygenase family protein [Paenibacillus sp. B01]
MSIGNQLPELNDTVELSAAEREGYLRDGHAIIRQLARPDEIAAYREVIGEVVREHNYHTKPLEERDTYGKAFIQIGNVWELSEAARRFVFARRFAKAAADLMGVPAVRIYHDQALFKEPGGGHTPWHQDQIYWPLDTDKTITLWMPLVPVPEEVGSMTFVSGSHKNGYISKQEISDESHRTLKAYIEQKGLPQINYGAMAAGDATFHAGWTLHSAPGNPTSLMREVMTVIYIADGLTIAEPDSGARRSDLARWFPELSPGDAAASRLNPILYP